MLTIAHSNTCENKKDFSFSGFPVGSCRKDGAQEAPPPFHSHLMQLIRLVLAKVYFSRPAFFPEQYGLLIVRACCVNISIVSLHLLFSLFSFSLFLFPFFYSTVPSSPLPSTRFLQVLVQEVGVNVDLSFILAVTSLFADLPSTATEVGLPAS